MQHRIRLQRLQALAHYEADIRAARHALRQQPGPKRLHKLRAARQARLNYLRLISPRP